MMEKKIPFKMRIVFVGLTAILFVNAAVAEGQDTLGIKVPTNRILIHRHIDMEQAKAINMLNDEDKSAETAADKTADLKIEHALNDEVNKLEISIEKKDQDHRHKMIYLSGLYEMLKKYNVERRYGNIDEAYAPMMINNFRDMMQDDVDGKSIAIDVEGVPYQVAAITVGSFPLNFGYRVARSILLREYGKQYPEDFLHALNTTYIDFANQPFADTIIATIARKYPMEVYNYATSPTTVGNIVRHNYDSIVQTIVKIGQSNSAVKLLPFLDYIVDGEYTIPKLEKITADNDAYYKLVVKTMRDMERNKLLGNPPVGLKAMRENVKIRALKYIRIVNDLHESPDAVRFACVNDFSAQEIYYLLINGQEEIYTSSFVGLYKRMMEKMNPPKGDRFLMSLSFDRFKKFVTMSAAFNTLNDFLTSMQPENASLLMKQFVSGLEVIDTTESQADAADKLNLEDAVDVADAFASIKDSSLLVFLQQQVVNNYRHMVSEGNERGKIIYGLLSTLFTSRVSSTKDEVQSKNIAKNLNLPPIDVVPFKSLESDSGRVFEQVFFYGDKDGIESYASFMTNFPSRDWQKSSNNFWTTIISRKGKPITIYANKPLAAPDDDKAIAALSKYLKEKDIHPTVYIHRGHSYHVQATLQELQSSAKVVMLGSCGGYHSLASVLNVAPDAQIISSKQTGSMVVNEPIIRTIENNIREGKNLDWVKMWQHLNNDFSGRGKELFQDYIPPFKNLGAIFIKAYRQLMKENKNHEMGLGVNQ